MNVLLRAISALIGFPSELKLHLWKPFLLQEHSACAKDGDFYCAQQLASLLMQNSKCYVKFFLPATPRTPGHRGITRAVKKWGAVDHFSPRGRHSTRNYERVELSKKAEDLKTSKILHL